MRPFIGCRAMIQQSPYYCGEFGLYCPDCFKARIECLEEEVILFNEYDDDEHYSHLPKIDRKQEMTNNSRKWKRIKDE